MTDKSEFKLPNLRFPATEMMVALMKMTPEQRARASAEKAAARYGLPLERCEFEINWWRGVP